MSFTLFDIINNFDIGRPGIEAIELARVIDRGIRESGFIDFKKLCIKFITLRAAKEKQCCAKAIIILIPGKKV